MLIKLKTSKKKKKMVSKAFFKSMKITPFIRPLSILTDQLLEAPNKDISVL